MAGKNTDSTNLGSIVRFARKKAKLTQAELGILAHCSKTVVFDIEHGKQTIQFDSINKLLHVLNIKIEFTGPIMESFWESVNTKYSAENDRRIGLNVK